MLNGNKKLYLLLSLAIVIIASISTNLQQFWLKRTFLLKSISDSKLFSDPEPVNVTFRLLAVERYFDSTPMKSAQNLIKVLVQFKNWQNLTWGNYTYRSYIHLLSQDPDVKDDPQMKKYYRGEANKDNIVNEIKNFLAATGPGESNNLTVRIFYYCDHSGKYQEYVNGTAHHGNYLLVGKYSWNPDHVIKDKELNQALLSGDLGTSNCTLLIFDSCYSGGFTNSLARKGRVILTACNNWQLAHGKSEGWSIFTGKANAYQSDGTYFGPLGIIGAISSSGNVDNNGDGWLCANEIFDFAWSTTKRFTIYESNYYNDKGLLQHPQRYYGVLGGAIPLAMSSDYIIIWKPGVFPPDFKCIENGFKFNPPPTEYRYRKYPSWSMLGNTPDRTSFYSTPPAWHSPTITSGDFILWNISLYEPILSSPVADYGLVIFISTSTVSSKIYCLNPATGSILWKFISQGPISSSPAIGNDKLFVGTQNGNSYILDITTGRILQQFNIGNHTASPAISEGIIFTVTSKNETSSTMWALNLTTSMPIWNATFTGKVFASPTISEEKVYIATRQGDVVAFDEWTGQTLWNVTLGEEIFSTPAAAYGLLFIGTAQGNLYALNMQSGEIFWSMSLTAPIHSSLAVDQEEGNVIVCATDGTVRAITALSGDIVWETSIGPINMSSPAITSDGLIYVGSLDSNVYSLNRINGEIMGNCSLDSPVESSPAIWGNNIFIGSTNGRALCFGPEFPRHNIAIVKVEVSPMIFEVGQTVNLNVNLTNKGNMPETFNLICAYNITDVWQAPTYINPVLFCNDTITLEPSENTTLNYQLNTTEIEIGTYSLIVYIPEVEYEIDVSDNVFISSHLKAIGHDIAIMKIETSKRYPSVGETIYIFVTIANCGNFSETFNFYLNCSKLYDPLIEAQIITLAPREAITLNLTWTPSMIGTYEIIAYTNQITGDVNPDNNFKKTYVYVISAAGGYGGSSKKLLK